MIEKYAVDNSDDVEAKAEELVKTGTYNITEAREKVVNDHEKSRENCGRVI